MSVTDIATEIHYGQGPITNAQAQELVQRITELEGERDTAENAAGMARAAVAPLKEELATVEAERDQLRLENVELREQIAAMRLAK